MNAYRFSIAWPRIQPDGSGEPLQAGIDYYRRLAQELLDAGIQPWATLYHWDLPQALEDEGGWLNRDTAYKFADYARIMAKELGDLVTNWITLNEPWCSAFLGYASGDHAPGRKEGNLAAQAAHNLLLGHGLAMEQFRKLQPDANVGISLNLYSVVPASKSAADREAARRIDGLSNRLFLDPILLGEYPRDVIKTLDHEEWFAQDQVKADLELISVPLDFLGINYYSRHTIAAGVAPDFPVATANPGAQDVTFVDTGADKTFMGWEIHPDGLLDVLEMANHRAPNLPLYITENGSAWDDVVEGEVVEDPERTKYLQDHIKACLDAVEMGLPLKGYFTWSLIDNFEWSFGYSRRFGIVAVDYDTLARIPKRSGLWYQEFLHS